MTLIPEKFVISEESHFPRVMSKNDYETLRNEEIEQAVNRLSRMNMTWAQMAATMLDSIGSMAPEHGSHHHQCILVAEMLMKELENHA